MSIDDWRTERGPSWWGALLDRLRPRTPDAGPDFVVDFPADRGSWPGVSAPPAGWIPGRPAPPVPPQAAVTDPRPHGPVRQGPAPGPHPAHAGALAAAFATDYLSWDESDPGRRGRALGPYVGQAGTEDLATIGWPGTGRQRADFALLGPVRPTGRHRVVVHVRVRVTPYRRLSNTPKTTAEAGDVLPFPAAAPAPAALGWKSLDSYWCGMIVPVIAVAGRWVVDITTVHRMPPVDGMRPAP